MRILYLGWQKGKAGGVPIYTESLSQGFRDRGNEVAYLYVGEHDIYGKPYLRQFSDAKGIQYVELVNSVNEYLNLRAPLREIKEPKPEALVLKYLRNFDPHIIHVQNLMGFSSSLLEVAADLGYPVIVSHHNYWFLCPRVELFRSDNRLCQGPRDGINCAWCCEIPVGRYKTLSSWFRMKRAIRGTIKPIVRLSAMVSRIEKVLRSREKAQFIVPARGKVVRGSIALPALEDHYILEKNIDLDAISQYSLRTRYHRFLLSEKTMVNLAVSSAVKDILMAFGIPEDKIVVQHIGTRAAEFVQSLAKPRIDEQVLFGFLGPLRYEKGVHVLLQAFAKLDQLKCSLNIYGPFTDDPYFNYLQSLAGGYKVSFRGPYSYEDLSIVLKDIHYLVVPPVWFDNAAQVVFESLASKTPVIGAEIGGIPDFVRRGENGLLFKPNDVEGLRICMQQVIDDRTLLARLQSTIKPMKTIQEHILELEKFYGDVVTAHTNYKV